MNKIDSGLRKPKNPNVRKIGFLMNESTIIFKSLLEYTTSHGRTNHANIKE